MKISSRDEEYLKTKAYLMQHSENPTFKNARQLTCFEHFAMVALDQIAPHGHRSSTPLAVIYSDLFDAYSIAELARPITMGCISPGQWFRWYEITIMPHLILEKSDS